VSTWDGKEAKLFITILAGAVLFFAPRSGMAQCCSYSPNGTCLMQCPKLDPLSGTLAPPIGDSRMQTPHVELRPVPTAPISAPAQLYIAARPWEDDETVADLKEKAAAELQELRARLWLVSFRALTTTLAFQGKSTASEDMVREAREHCRKYLEYTARINARSGEIAEAERRRDEQMRNLTVIADGPYVVHTSDAAVVGHYFPSDAPKSTSQSDPPRTDKPKGTHIEVSYTIEKVPKKAGFDSNGQPYYRMGWDVVRREREVPD